MMIWGKKILSFGTGLYENECVNRVRPLVTPVIIEELLARGLVRPGTRPDLGRVGGGIAVRKGAPRPAIGTPEELKRALLAAKEIYHANPKTATAGAYF